MMNKPLPFKGLNIRIPSIIPIEGRGFKGSGIAPKMVVISEKISLLTSSQT